MAIDLQALKDELDNDPLTRGYSGMDDVQAADSLNQQDRQPDRDVLTASMIVSALVESEYDALAARAKTYLGLLISAGEVVINPTTKSQIGAVFGAGTTTRANLLAAIQRIGSRADELGLGTVTPSNVADARRLP